jgi:hypothetical protein
MDAQAKTYRTCRNFNRYRDRIFQAGNRKHQVLKLWREKSIIKEPVDQLRTTKGCAVKMKSSTGCATCLEDGETIRTLSSSLYDYLNRITVAGRGIRRFRRRQSDL